MSAFPLENCHLVCGFCWRPLADNESATFKAHLADDCPFTNASLEDFGLLPTQFCLSDAPIVDWMAE